jgi:hypothetical protein
MDSSGSQQGPVTGSREHGSVVMNPSDCIRAGEFCDQLSWLTDSSRRFCSMELVRKCLLWKVFREKLLFSGMWNHVVWKIITGVSGECVASIFSVDLMKWTRIFNSKDVPLQSSTFLFMSVYAH